MKHETELQLFTVKRHGFTIVELLIVIVVIAILAAITIVAFNGVNSRAKDSVARADLNSIAKRIELARADSGAYPVFTNGTPAPELESLLRETGLWANTRAAVDASNDGVVAVQKSFAFCSTANYSQFIIVAMAPISTGFVSSALADSVGKKLVYYSFQDNRIMETTFKFDVPGQNTIVNVCKSVMPDYNYTVDLRRWSFDVPTLKAQ